VNGKIEKVDEITAKTLFDYYRKALAEDELDLYVIGDVDEQQVSELCEEQLSFDEREPISRTTINSVCVNKVKEIKDNQDEKQGKLNIGYRTNIRYGDDDYFALQVFNGIFGGFSHSKLFINELEKASLAYYASSQIESHKGLLIVMSGIEFENYEKTTGIIHKQMEAMKKGDFSEIEIEQTKAVIKNQLLETIDTARGSVEVLYHNV